MSATQDKISNETFRSLAFPVARCRFVGPTNYKGSRYSASIRRDNERTYRTTVTYDDALSPGQNALEAALKCWARALAENDPEASVADYVAIPGDLDANGYAFTFVPSYFFNGLE